jgi:hypothetical protein
MLVAAVLAACSSDRSTATGTPATDTPADEAPAVVEASSRTRFRDTETGSLWNLRGKAISGPLTGESLQPIPAYSAYWFAWASFWPQTAVWDDGADGAFRDDAFARIANDEFIPDLPTDAIPPLDDPEIIGRAVFVVAGAGQVADDDIVIGLEIDGDARAYPVRVLNFHEIVNHEVGGLRIVVTYCPLTASGIVFDATYEFGNTGGLYNNNMVMYDRHDRSLWSQMRASAILGDKSGSRLDLLPVYQGTWAAWRQLVPETLVLSTDTGHQRPYAGDIYVERGYTTSREIWFPQRPTIDARFHPKVMTLGLVGELGTRAYPHSLLRRAGPAAVVNDEFEGTPVVVVFDGGAQSAVPFSRRLGERTLHFEVAD